MVPSRVPDMNLTVAVNSNACASSRCDRSVSRMDEVHVLCALWDKGVAGIGFCSSLEA